MRGVLKAGNLVSKVGFVGGLAAGHGVEAGATGHVVAGAVNKGAAVLANRALRAQVEKRSENLMLSIVTVIFLYALSGR